MTWWFKRKPAPPLPTIDELGEKYRGWLYGDFCQHAPIDDVVALLTHVIKEPA